MPSITKSLGRNDSAARRGRAEIEPASDRLFFVGRGEQPTVQIDDVFGKGRTAFAG